MPVRTQANISSRYGPPWRNSRSDPSGCHHESAVAHTAIVSAQTSMTATARPVRPARRQATITGNAARTLRIGSSHGRPAAQPRAYEATVAAQTTAAARPTRQGPE